MSNHLDHDAVGFARAGLKTSITDILRCAALNKEISPSVAVVRPDDVVAPVENQVRLLYEFAVVLSDPLTR